MNLNIQENIHIIGIYIRTSNNSGSAEQDIPALWNKFKAENIISTISNKLDENIYCVYTEYESDYTKPYTTI